MASSSMSGGGRRPASLFPWLVPQPRPEPESEPEVTSVTPMVDIVSSNPPAQQTPPPGGNQPSQSPHGHGDRTGSQSGGQASSSKSDEKGSAGDSQAENSTDADRRKDETSVHDELLDYGDGQEDDYIPGLMAGLGPNRQPKYISLDVIGVKQLLEVRPFTVDRIIATSDSFETACGHLFACPEDVGGVGVIRQAWRLFQGGGGGSEDSSGDAPNDVQETFTLDDVRQFTEIDLATETFDAEDAAHYEKLLEAVFEYVIVFDDENYNYNPEDKIRQMHNLARSNLHIVDYLNEVFVNDDKTSGLTAFQQYFSESKHGQLKVSLGADGETGGAALGRVPLPESTTKNLDTMFLGSHVDIPAIVHEFGHVISRSVDIAAMYDAAESAFKDTWLDRTGGVHMDLTIYTNSIKGLAGRQRSTHEVWADIFMTAVLDPLVTGIDPPYEQLSVKMEDIYDLPYVGFYDCEDRDNECVKMPVQWRRYRNGRLWNNADAVRVHVGEILSELLLPKNGGDIND